MLGTLSSGVIFLKQQSNFSPLTSLKKKKKRSFISSPRASPALHRGSSTTHTYQRFYYPRRGGGATARPVWSDPVRVDVYFTLCNRVRVFLPVFQSAFSFSMLSFPACLAVVWKMKYQKKKKKAKNLCLAFIWTQRGFNNIFFFHFITFE